MNDNTWPYSFLHTQLLVKGVGTIGMGKQKTWFSMHSSRCGPMLSPKLQCFALSRNIGGAKARPEGVNEMTYFLTSTDHSFPVYHLALGPEKGD